jgi:hypothetical protein
MDFATACVERLIRIAEDHGCYAQIVPGHPNCVLVGSPASQLQPDGTVLECSGIDIVKSVAELRVVLGY